VTFLVALYAGALLALAVGLALLAGWNGPPEDGDGVWLIGRGLFLSALFGVAGVACALKAARRPIRPWLLTLGLLPALAQVLRLTAQ
jgi:hypothetical protein